MGLNPLFGMLAGVAIAAALALVTGFPTLRLKGHPLGARHLAVGMGFYASAVASPYFNGSTGIGGIPAFSVSPLTAELPFAKFWLCGILLTRTVIAVAQAP